MEIDIVKEIKKYDNPTIKAKKLEFYISDLLHAHKLKIYEAYLLYNEVLSYRKDGYLMSAWGGRVQISTCLELLNQRLLALVFEEKANSDLLMEWGLEALQLCAEKRTHYIMDRYEEYIHIQDNNDRLLYDLLDIRRKYSLLDDKGGPYHVEVFPYHFFEPEKILLEKSINLCQKTEINPEIENIMIELYL